MISRSLRARLGSLACGLLFACADSPTKPNESAKVDFESADNRQLLLAILNKLDALEKRAETESRLMYARIDSVARLYTVAGPQAAQPLKPSAGFEAQLCGKLQGTSRGEIKANAEIHGRGLGSVGVHAAGNGAWAGAFAQAGTVTGVITDGRLSGELEICAKLGAESELAPTVRALLNDAIAAASNVTSNLATFANSFGVNSTRMNSGISALNSFSISNLRFGQGPAAALLAGLPLPADLRGLLENPRQIFTRTAEAVQFGIDQMCDSPNWPAAVAQLVANACSLRNQFPSAQSLLALLQGLGGIPGLVQQLGSNASELCAAVNFIRPVSFSIPAQHIDLGALGTYTTFPGFSRTLFPGLAQVC